MDNEFIYTRKITLRGTDINHVKNRIYNWITYNNYVIKKNLNPDYFHIVHWNIPEGEYSFEKPEDYKKNMEISLSKNHEDIIIEIKMTSIEHVITNRDYNNYQIYWSKIVENMIWNIDNKITDNVLKEIYSIKSVNKYIKESLLKNMLFIAIIALISYISYIYKDPLYIAIILFLYIINTAVNSIPNYFKYKNIIKKITHK